MRSLDEWFELYSQSHQNKINKRIHFICVPLIMFSILGILWEVAPILSVIVVIAGTIYYFRLSKALAFIMLVVSLIMLLIIDLMNYRLQICIALFIVSWIFQFIGHKIEGKKPSFVDNLQFLLIGPLWIIYELFYKKK